MIGFHFYNPPAVQKLLEVIAPEGCDPELEAMACELARILKKKTVPARDIAGFIGNVVATRLVGELGTWATAGVFIGCTFVGLLSWSLGAGYLPAMGAGLGFIGLGFAATNSMQQARLVQAAPELSSASVALNTSGVYVGQAIGSGVGGILFGLGWLHGIGFVGLAFAAAGLGVWSVTRDR